MCRVLALAVDGVNDAYPTDRATGRGGGRADRPGRPEHAHRANALRTLAHMDLRIGVTQAPRESASSCPTTPTATALRTQVEAALTGAVDVLWLTDKKGRHVAVAAAKIAYVEIGTADGDRRIGFGG